VNTNSEEGQPLHLLVVEDHESTLAALGKLLTRAGYRVETANSVAAALDLAKNERFDLLVSDLALPDGSGLEIMSRLRAEQEIGGICMSGYATDEDLRRSREAGFYVHLTKPIEFSQLCQAISDYRRAGGSSGAVQP
jgi:CheY-like chemotaxis protein